MIRRIVILAAAAVVVAAAAPGPASAAWSRARLMTTNGVEQALISNPSQDVETAPVISADGRYLAFWTQARNLLAFAGPGVQSSTKSAVLRRDVDGGLLELVAVTQEPSVSSASASAVAMSADGRFVAFTTARALDGGSDGACDAESEDCDMTVDVYVRDMARAVDAPGAFRLATPGAEPGDWGLPGPRALSADGTRMLVVRDRMLVLRDLTTGSATELTDTLNASSDGAVVLSGDGTTATWVDDDPRSRVDPGQYLSGESPLGSALLPGTSDPTFNIADLLWRRVDSPLARRVATAGDSEDPACPPGRRLEPDGVAIVGIRDACDGVFRQLPEVRSFGAAALSSDGRAVAFVTNARRRSGLAGIDVFLRSMDRPGGRKATTTELTGFVGTGALPAIEMSADGRTVALAAGNDRSALASPSFVSASLGEGPVNVYVIDLSSATVERVTASFSGEPADAGLGSAKGSVSPALSADGRRIAFYSTSTNLLFGDTNGIGDVFVADRFEDRQPPLAQVGADGLPSVEVVRSSEVFPIWRLGVSVSRGGSVLYVDALVPGRGTVTATARPTRRVKGRKRQPVIRTGRARVSAAGKVRVRLRLPAKYRKAARRSSGLPVRVTVQFRSSGGATLTERLDSKYRYKPKRVKSKKSTRAKSRKSAQRTGR